MHSIQRILIFLTVLFLVSSSRLFAQEQDKEQSKAYMEQAQLMVDAGSIALEDIRDVMIQAAEFDTTNLKANFEAGHLFLETINKELATKFLLRLYRQKPDYRFDLEYWIGQSYQYGLYFDKAIDFYTRYKNKLQKQSTVSPARVPMKDVDRRIFECQNGNEFVSNPKNFTITNIGPEVNSEFEDYAPVLNEAETEIVFTSRRRDGNMNENVFDDNKPWEDIYYSKKKDSAWTPAKNIGSPVSAPNHESTLALSPDGNTLFIYKDERAGDIYSSVRKPDGTWSVPERLPGIINSANYTESSASINSTGTVIYFASNRLGGLGGSDIYVCTKDTRGQWSIVKNLGPKINTEYDEEGPFIDYEGKTLYFSSRGRKGMGRYDIFKSTLINADKGEWSEPENLGYPINTPDDDAFFISSRDGRRAYYASVREDGLGYSDIYRIETQDKKKKEPATVASGKVGLKFSVRVFDAATKAPLDAKVKLAGANDEVVVASTSARPGAFEFSIEAAEAKDYRLSVERQGYLFQNLMVNLPGTTGKSSTITRTVELKKIAIGMSSVLRNIYFDSDKASLKQESLEELTQLENMMKQNGTVKVEISGHTDNVGADEYNNRLSLERATAVMNFLTSNGIDARRIRPIGYGDQHPLVSNDDEEGREINRRVEFKVIGN